MSFLLWQSVRTAAEANPDRLAVTDGSSPLTYAELEEASSAVCAYLLAAGLEPGDRVGIVAPKSSRCVASLLGVLKAGGCYVPVDPRAPAARVQFILRNADVRFVVSEDRLFTALDLSSSLGHPSERILLLDDGVGDQGTGWSDLSSFGAASPASRTEFDPAYILYTSGSTGEPKGVVISHRNALTFVDWARTTFHISNEDRLSNHAPFHFDLSVLDLYGALTAGASVHLVPDSSAPFPSTLAQWIDETGISVWYSVPSALIRLLKKGDLGRFEFEQLRCILFAGEVFPVKHLRPVMEAFPHASFHNLYGPTETNVCTFYSVPRPIPPEMESLPIGRSCANIETFALSEDGGKCDEGEVGELLVRGPCVMQGYWGLPERTQQSIMQNPLHDDYLDPVYRTGDRVSVLPDGGYSFLGRTDHMVKVRGYRVELGEIEVALNAHAGVREAAVVALPDDEVGATLHAAVVPAEDSKLDSESIKKHCLNRLLRYAVPETVTFISELPRTSTGKIDRVTLGKSMSSDL